MDTANMGVTDTTDMVRNMDMDMENNSNEHILFYIKTIIQEFWPIYIGKNLLFLK